MFDTIALEKRKRDENELLEIFVLFEVNKYAEQIEACKRFKELRGLQGYLMGDIRSILKDEYDKFMQK